MALSLDDRLLGEKVHNYCSSSEDEDEDSADEGAKVAGTENEVEPPQLDQYSGRSSNTGPKGVIKDWQRYKQLENEKREEDEKERAGLAKKFTMTCQSALDEERERAELELVLEDDDFLREYRNRRIQELSSRVIDTCSPRFGKVVSLTKEGFLPAIDQEPQTVTIVVHIYEMGVSACKSMNGSLVCLAEEYPTVKFCKLRASDAKLSFTFAANGVPALLVYKKGELIGNFIRLSDEFGEEFFASDVESFLVEHGMLPDKTLIPGVIKNPDVQDSTSDSDFDVD